MELPFLVVHGAIAWKVAVVVLTLALLGAIHLLRWIGARRATSFQVANVRAVVEGVTECSRELTLRGTLRGGTLTSLVDGEYGRAYDHVEGAPHLECADGTRVDIGVAPRVLAGTRERVSHLGWPASTPSSMRIRRGAWKLRTVSPGDEIIVNGDVTRSSEARDYRTGADTWKLVAGSAIAVRPRAVPEPLHALVVLVVVALCSAFSYGAIWFTGTFALERMMAKHGERLADADLPVFDSLALAAASPLRAAAFKEAPRYLEGRLGYTADRHDVIADALIASGTCDGFDFLLDRTRYEDALALARMCGDREREATAQLFLGHYAAASDSHALPDDLREHAAIGAGRWGTAATLALRPPKASYDRQDGRCRAVWYLSVAGSSEPAPLDKLGSCELYAALREPADVRILDVESLVYRPVSPLGYPGYLLQALDGVTGYRGLDGKTTDADWLALHAPIRADDAGQIALESRLHVALVLGRFEEARAGVPALQDDTGRETFAVHLALRTGRLPPRDPELEDDDQGVALRAGVVREPSQRPSAPDGDDDDIVALHAAAQGNARLLAEALAHRAITDEAHVVLAALGMASAGREMLAVAYLSQEDFDSYARHFDAPRLVDMLAMRRDIARLGSNTGEVERLQAIIERHAAVLADRDRAVGLALLSR